jgi:hypothetical protein
MFFYLTAQHTTRNIRIVMSSHSTQTANGHGDSAVHRTQYEFTIAPTNRAAFVRVSDDRTHDEATQTARMFQNCFPGARVEFRNRAA